MKSPEQTKVTNGCQEQIYTLSFAGIQLIFEVSDTYKYHNVYSLNMVLFKLATINPVLHMLNNM